MTTALCIRVCGIVSKSLILINKTYLCVVNLHCKHWWPFRGFSPCPCPCPRTSSPWRQHWLDVEVRMVSFFVKCDLVASSCVMHACRVADRTCLFFDTWTSETVVFWCVFFSNISRVDVIYSADSPKCRNGSAVVAECVLDLTCTSVAGPCLFYNHFLDYCNAVVM